MKDKEMKEFFESLEDDSRINYTNDELTDMMLNQHLSIALRKLDKLQNIKGENYGITKRRRIFRG